MSVLRPAIKIIVRERQLPILTAPVTLKSFQPIPRNEYRKLTTEEIRRTQNKHGTHADWSYAGANGPENWQNSFPVAASTYQSPVNIEPDEAKHDSTLAELLLHGYDRKTSGCKLKLENNGSTAKLCLEGGCTFSRSDLSSTYEALFVCFHWGTDNDAGSEHLVDGKPYPMEVQIVHKNTKYTEDEMFDKQDGLLILAYFVEVGQRCHENLKYVTSHLNHIKYKGQQTQISQFSLRSILPNDISSYYQYVGSLTTPPCNECVTWIVLLDTVKMSHDQIEKFRHLHNGEDHSSEYLSNNFRPTQRLYRRSIKTNAS